MNYKKELRQAITAINSLTIRVAHCNEHDLCCSTKTEQYSDARKAVIYYLRERGLSLHDIGALIKRNHTTVLHQYRTFCDLAKSDPRTRKIKEELDNSVPRHSYEARKKQYEYHMTKATTLAKELGLGTEVLT